jgi:hypothetical protein
MEIRRIIDHGLPFFITPGEARDRKKSQLAVGLAQGVLTLARA